MAYDVPLADKDEVREYILERIALHKEAMELPDDQLPPCTPEERWANPTTWAVYKNSNKTAYRVLGSEDEARGLLTKMAELCPKDEFRIEVRPGADRRCESFCSVAKWCEYFKKKGGD
jgi:hypothetical protein